MLDCISDVIVGTATHGIDLADDYRVRTPLHDTKRFQYIPYLKFTVSRQPQNSTGQASTEEIALGYDFSVSHADTCSEDECWDWDYEPHQFNNICLLKMNVMSYYVFGGASHIATLNQVEFTYLEDYEAPGFPETLPGDMYAIYDKVLPHTDVEWTESDKWMTLQSISSSSTYAVGGSAGGTFFKAVNIGFNFNYSSKEEVMQQLNHEYSQATHKKWTVDNNKVGLLMGRGYLRRKKDGTHIFIPYEKPNWSVKDVGNADQYLENLPLVDLANAWGQLGLTKGVYTAQSIPAEVGTYRVIVSAGST